MPLMELTQCSFKTCLPSRK